MRAVTDSGSEVKGGADKPALENLLNIYSLLSGRSVKEIEKEYVGRGYGDFKKGLANVVVGFLTDFQKKFNEITDAEAMKILQAGTKKAEKIAAEKMLLVRKKIGLLN